MSQVQAQTKGLTLLWRFAQPPLRYRRQKRILAIRERTPPSVWFGDRVQLPAEVSWQEKITHPLSLHDALPIFDLRIKRCLVEQQQLALGIERGNTARFPQC